MIKGQPFNMPMLRRMLELGCTLIDYEKVTDDQGRRLIFFGWHAGVAGMLETLWALGKRLAWEGIDTPFARLGHPSEYRNLAEAKADVAKAAEAIRSQGLPEAITPLTIGVAGYGNVRRGVWDILDLLPIQHVETGELATLSTDPARARAMLSTLPHFVRNTLPDPRRQARSLTCSITMRIPRRSIRHSTRTFHIWTCWSMPSTGIRAIPGW